MNNEVSLKFENYVHGDKKLEKYAEHLNLVASALNAMDKGKLDILGKASNEMKNATIQKEKLNKKIDFGINMVGLSKLKNLLQSATNTISKLSKKSAEYIENVNLLEVAYANTNETIEESSERIETFIRKMSEVYGFDESRLTRQFGIFKQLANAMKLPTETAENLSELMVKMSNDIASLYNLDLDRASNALQSALAGQVRPIRSATGADITEKTLQNTVDALGLDTTINQLSYVEKRLIMVISLTEQLKKSQGDYGRTIESVANQMKVLQEQWDRLTRAVGNVFYPLIQSILPYLNGIIMALTEIFNMIASLLGFEMPSFDYSGLAGTSDAVLDLEDELNGASASVDKLSKKLSGLRSFDKLNVITTPKNSGSSASAGAGSINPKILEAFNKSFGEYDDMLGKIRMKANDIRDSIMKWLGFTKKINPLTGEVEWKYEGIGKTFSNMLDSFSKLSFPVRTVVTSLLLLGGVKIAGAVSSLGKMLGNLTGISKIMPALTSKTELFSKTALELWGETATKAEKLTTALIGAGGLYLGFTMIGDAMDSISDKGLSVSSALELLGGTVSNVLGGAMLLGAIDPALAPLGAFSGLIFSIVEGFGGWKSEEEKFADQIKKNLEPIQEYNNELQRQFDIISENAEQTSVQIGIHENFYSELTKIVDENGKVKQGYEDRAQFIITELNKAYGLEIQMVDGVIQEYGKQKKAIEEIIEQKKIEMQLDIASQKYKIAKEEETKAYKNLTEAEKNYKEIKDKLTDAMKNNKRAAIDLLPAYFEAEKAVKSSKKTYEETQQAILAYSNVVKYAEEGNAEQVEYWTNRMLRDHERQAYSYQTLVGEAQEAYNTRLEIAEKEGKKLEDMNASEKALLDEKYQNLVTALINEKEAIYDNEDDYVRAWATVASHSKEMFMENIDDLPDDIKAKVVNKMYDLGTDINSQLQYGLDKSSPYIKFKTNLPDVATKINKFASEVKNSGLGKSDLLNLGSSSKVFANPYYYSTNALGGMPPVGQLFVANEKGPELVGQIGGRTFVANQNQMMDLLDKKIGNAQNKTPQVINLYLDADHKIGSYTIEQLQNMAKTDGKPITIGG